MNKYLIALVCMYGGSAAATETKELLHQLEIAQQKMSDNVSKVGIVVEKAERKVEELKQEAAEAQEKLRQAQQTASAQQQTIASLKQQHGQVLQTHKQELDAQQQAHEEQQAALAGELHAERTRAAHSTAREQQISAQLTRLQEALDEAHSELDTSGHNKKLLEQQIARLKQEIASLREIEKNDALLRNCKFDLSQKEREISTLEKQLKTQKTDHASHISDLISIHDGEVSGYEAKIAAHTKQIQQLSERLKSSDENNEALTEKVRSVNEQLTQREEAILQARGQNRHYLELQKENEQLHKERDGRYTEEQMRTLFTEGNRKLGKKIEELQTIIEILTQEKQAQKKTIETLHEHLKKLIDATGDDTSDDDYPNESEPDADSGTDSDDTHPRTHK